MMGRSRGIPLTPVLTVCRLKAGIAITTKTAVPSTREMTGCLSTRSTMADQKPASPPSPLPMRCLNGTRPHSTRSPSFDSTAGSTVNEPSTAIATTMIVPVANDMKVALPVTYMPAIAMITVTPETSTARPDVDAAACRDTSSEFPAALSSRSRRR